MSIFVKVPFYGKTYGCEESINNDGKLRKSIDWIKHFWESLLIDLIWLEWSNKIG